RRHLPDAIRPFYNCRTRDTRTTGQATPRPNGRDRRRAEKQSSAMTGRIRARRSRSALRRIAFIVFAQRIGFSLEEIGAELAKLPSDRIPTRMDWKRLSGAWTKRIDQRIAELQRLRAGLTQCIGCGCLSIDKCRLANPAQGLPIGVYDLPSMSFF